MVVNLKSLLKLRVSKMTRKKRQLVGGNFEALNPFIFKFSKLVDEPIKLHVKSVKFQLEINWLKTYTDSGVASGPACPAQQD